MDHKYGLIAEKIRSWEGCKLQSYQDAGGVWTIGYGYTHGIYKGMEWPMAKAEGALWAEIDKCASQIESVVTEPLNDNQMQALISFVYNVGFGAFLRSTLIKKLNQGEPKEVVAAEFLKWDHVAGRVLSGLTERRKYEYDLYLS